MYNRQGRIAVFSMKENEKKGNDNTIQNVSYFYNLYTHHTWVHHGRYSHGHIYIYTDVFVFCILTIGEN